MTNHNLADLVLSVNSDECFDFSSTFWAWSKRMSTWDTCCQMPAWYKSESSFFYETHDARIGWCGINWLISTGSSQNCWCGHFYISSIWCWTSGICYLFTHTRFYKKKTGSRDCEYSNKKLTILFSNLFHFYTWYDDVLFFTINMFNLFLKN